MMTPGDSLISKGWGSGPLPLPPPSGSAHVWLTLCHKIKRYLMWCLKVQVIVWLSANYFFQFIQFSRKQTIKSTWDCLINSYND